MYRNRIGCAGWFFIIIGSIFALVLAITLISLAVDKQKDKKREEERALQAAAELAAAEAYDELFSPVLKEGYTCGDDADKAVAVYYEPDEEEGTCVDRFIPEDLKAETPEDVRYLIEIRYHNKADGIYGIPGASDNSTAWRRCYTIQIYDLTDGALLIGQEFEGMDPPTVSSPGVDQYGNYPKDSAVTEWIPTGIEEGLANHLQDLEELAFIEAMSVLLESGYRCPETASKAVAVRTETVEGEETQTCCTEYIPEELLAEVPEEVRWLVQYSCKLNTVGMYMLYGNAYQPETVFEIIDLTDGSIIAENSFLGEEPPASISSKEEAIGAYPNPAEITAWISSVIGE